MDQQQTAVDQSPERIGPKNIAQLHRCVMIILVRINSQRTYHAHAGSLVYPYEQVLAFAFCMAIKGLGRGNIRYPRVCI